MSDQSDHNEDRWIEHLPAMKYVFAVAAVAGVVAEVVGIYQSLQLGSPAAFILITVAVLIGALVIFLIARLIGSRNRDVSRAGTVLVWLAVICFVVCAGLMVSLATFRQPKYLADWLNMPDTKTAPGDDLDAEVKRILSVLSVADLPAGLHSDRTVAENFIDQHTYAYCQLAPKDQEICQGTAVVVPIIPVTPPPLNQTIAAPETACASTALGQDKAARAPIYGTVVSHFNAGDTDWNALRQSGYRYAVIKVSQGLNFVDPAFESSWAAAGKAGLIRVPLHLLTGSGDPTEQAKFFLTVLNRVTFGPCDLGPLVDLEWNPSSTATMSQAAAWLKTVEGASKVTPMLYVPSSYLPSSADTSALVKYPLWIASYKGGPPKLPAGYSRYTFWDFTNGTDGDPGPMSGAQSFRFDGTREELLALTQPRQ